MKVFLECIYNKTECKHTLHIDGPEKTVKLKPTKHACLYSLSIK